MKVLDNYIGLRGVTPGTPKSGFYVNDLPGMSTELLDRIADPDLKGAEGVWRAVELRAQDKLRTMVTAALGLRHGYVSKIHSGEVQDLYEPGGVYQGGTGYVGILLTVPNVEKLLVTVENLEFFSLDGVENVGIAAYDTNLNAPVALIGQDGEPLTHIDVKMGTNEIPLSLAVEGRRTLRLFIGLEAAGLRLMSYGMLDPGFDRVQVSPATLDAGKEFFHHFLNQRGVPFMGLGFKVSCSIEKLVKRNIEAFRAPYWNLLGSEVLREKIHSTRVGFFSSTNQALSQENMKYLERQAQEAIPAIVEGLSLEELCVDCAKKGGVTYSYDSMP